MALFYEELEKQLLAMNQKITGPPEFVLGSCGPVFGSCLPPFLLPDLQAAVAKMQAELMEKALNPTYIPPVQNMPIAPGASAKLGPIPYEVSSKRKIKLDD